MPVNFQLFSFWTSMNIKETFISLYLQKYQDIVKTNHPISPNIQSIPLNITQYHRPISPSNITKIKNPNFHQISKTYLEYHPTSNKKKPNLHCSFPQVPSPLRLLGSGVISCGSKQLQEPRIWYLLQMDGWTLNGGHQRRVWTVYLPRCSMNGIFTRIYPINDPVL